MVARLVSGCAVDAGGAVQWGEGHSGAIQHSVVWSRTLHSLPLVLDMIGLVTQSWGCTLAKVMCFGAKHAWGGTVVGVEHLSVIPLVPDAVLLSSSESIFFDSPVLRHKLYKCF